MYNQHDATEGDSQEGREELGPSNPASRVTVICGANTEQLADVAGHTVEEVLRKMREILNIPDGDHIVLVNGKRVGDPSQYVLQGGEDVEVKKPSGEKGG